MSRDEVKELVEFLKKDFRIKTGMNLVAFPEARRIGKCKMSDVTAVTADFFDLSVEQLRSKTRRREVVRARQMLCALLYKMRYKLVEIGNYLNQDHTTVLHARNRFQNYVDTEEEDRLEYEQLTVQVQALKRTKPALPNKYYHETHSDQVRQQ